jgi:hypothetical protein
LFVCLFVCFALHLFCCSPFCVLMSLIIAISFFFFFDFHILFVFFLLHLLIYVCICFHFVSISFDFGYYIDPFCVFFFCLYFTQFIVVEKVNGSLSYTIGLCSVRRPYMNLLNFIVYYHNIAK